MKNIPPEIIYHIISYFPKSNDTKTLVTCAQVTRQWYDICIPYLWKTRALYDNENVNYCLNSHHLLHYIKTIILTNGPDWKLLSDLMEKTRNVSMLRVTRCFTNDQDFACISSILGHMRNVKCLSFEGSRFHFDPVELLTSCQTASGGIESVRLRNCDVHLLYRSTNTSITAGNNIAGLVGGSANGAAVGQKDQIKSHLLDFKCDGTTSFTDSLLMELVRTRLFSHLHTLSLERTSISDWSMINVIPVLANLRNLNLVGTHVTDETIECLTNNMQITFQLEELKLGTAEHPCIRVSPNTMHRLVIALNNVRVLYLNGCGVSRHITQHILVYRKNLEELDLGGSEIDQQIFDHLLWKKSECLEKLRFLGLSGCRMLTLECDAGARTVVSPFSRFVLNCKTLEKLDCSGMSRIRFAYVYGFRRNNNEISGGSGSNVNDPLKQRGNCFDSCVFGQKELLRLRNHITKIELSSKTEISGRSFQK